MLKKLSDTKITLDEDNTLILNLDNKTLVKINEAEILTIANYIYKLYHPERVTTQLDELLHANQIPVSVQNNITDQFQKEK